MTENHGESTYEGVTFKTNASKPDAPKKASTPDAPKKASTPSLFLVGCLCYIMLVLFPIHFGFGIDVKNMWAIVLPTLIFGWLMVIGGRK